MIDLCSLERKENTVPLQKDFLYQDMLLYNNILIVLHGKKTVFYQIIFGKKTKSNTVPWQDCVIEKLNLNNKNEQNQALSLCKNTVYSKV